MILRFLLYWLGGFIPWTVVWPEIRFAMPNDIKLVVGLLVSSTIAGLIIALEEA